MNWIDVFLFIIAVFLFAFLFIALMYVIGKLLGYIDNETKHVNPTNKENTKKDNINSNHHWY